MEDNILKLHADKRQLAEDLLEGTGAANSPGVGDLERLVLGELGKGLAARFSTVFTCTLTESLQGVRGEGAAVGPVSRTCGRLSRLLCLLPLLCRTRAF